MQIISEIREIMEGPKHMQKKKKKPSQVGKMHRNITCSPSHWEFGHPDVQGPSFGFTCWLQPQDNNVTSLSLCFLHLSNGINDCEFLTQHWWLNSEEPAWNAGDLGSIPGSGRSSGGGSGNPPQYSCLENSMHRGAWQGSQRVRHEWVYIRTHTALVRININHSD